MTTLAVIPSDPLSAYEAVGCHVWAERYYNPGAYFDAVHLLSPLEKKPGTAYGMQVVPTRPADLPARIRENGVDLVRAYGGYWACDMACNHKVRGVPVVVSVHDTNPEELYASIRRADYVFCMSEAVRDLVLTRFPRPDRVWILPNRYDRDVMRPLEGADFSDLDALYPWRYRLVCVGRLSEQKNQENLLRALPLLGEEYGCIFIGRNDPGTLQRLAEELAVASRCRFVEAVRNDLLARYYNWADAMVTPSRWEGFGIVFIEALACGAAVVTSNLRPMSEYIVHEQNGLLVDAFEDPAALAGAVRRICEDTALQRALRTAGPASVERFERRRVDALEIGYYQRVLAESRCEKAAGGPIRRLVRAARGGPDLAQGDVLQRCAARALKWVRYHSRSGKGIVHSPQMPLPYPEVTGYFIPTLLKWDEDRLAERYALWLLDIQNPDGSWNGVASDRPYTFDTGQILKGLLAIREHILAETTEPVPGLDRPRLEAALLRGGDWLAAQIAEDGRVGTPDASALEIPGGGTVPEAFHLYALSPLDRGGKALVRPDWGHAADRALRHYLKDPQCARFRCLSHFHAYILEALADLGAEEDARAGLREVLALQQPGGAVEGKPGAPWVCSTGLAQYALTWLKLGELDPARNALRWLCAHQNLSGGFFGSYGPGATYFPRGEISWAVKYFLDAVHLAREAEITL